MPAIARVRQALLARSPDCPFGPIRLDDRLGSLWDTIHGNTPDLHGLAEIITQAECRSGEGDGGRRWAAEVYLAAAAALCQVGYLPEAWICGDRAMGYARTLKDTLLVTDARFRIGHVMLANKQFEEAIAVATLTEPIADSAGISAMMEGALNLIKAVAYAELGQEFLARTFITKAYECAGRCGPLNDRRHTVFGHVNVQLHEIDILVRLGAQKEARRIADNVDLRELSDERCARLHASLRIPGPTIQQAAG